MALLAIKKIIITGLDSETLVAAASGGDTFSNVNEDIYFYVRNGGGGAVAVTINSVTNCNYGFDHNAVVSVPAGGERMIGIFPKLRFNDSSGIVSITYDLVTSVTVAPVQLTFA